MNAEQDYSFVIEGKMALPYQYFAGAIGSRFLVALRDDHKIYAVRDPRSGKVLVPPRRVSGETLERLPDDWTEVGPEGVVTGFTVIRYREPYQPKEPPYVLALIRLDNADSALVHLLETSDVANVRTGMRVKAVFEAETADNILAIRHFVPVSSTA